jgi:predicted nucleic acid-binding protein
MPAFADTSALAKLFVAEIGSAWMERAVLPLGITVSALAIVEMGSTLTRKVREGSLTDSDARDAWRTFRRELRRLTVLELTQAALSRAANVMARSPVPLRTLDGIHLSGALAADAAQRRNGSQPFLFVASDARLLAAATAHGLTTDDPERHP